MGVKTRKFTLEITIAGNDGKGWKSFTKSTSMEVEGSACMYANRVRDILQGLCKCLCEAISDTEIEEIVNVKER